MEERQLSEFILGLFSYGPDTVEVLTSSAFFEEIDGGFNKYDIEISDEDAETLTTVGSIKEYIKNYA